jgi:antitoxin ParD1/3/4
MAQMNVSLPEGLKAWVDQCVADGRFASASDYVRDLLRKDQDRAERLARLRAAIDHGRESGVSTRSLQDIYDAHMKRRDAA